MEPGRWRSRRFSAAAVRALTLVVPLFVGVLVSVALGRLLPEADGLLSLVRLLLILVVTTLAMMSCGSLMRRLLPLAVMLKLSWVFPDKVPSRFSVALRRSDYRRDGSAGPTGSAREVTDHLLDLVRRLNAHHRATRGHCERVRAYADLLGAEMGLSVEQRDKLAWAAALHDVGKVEVATEILDLPHRPSPEEWAVLVEHPMHGEVLTGPASGWLGEWAKGIWEHHERWDGKGYPNGLAGEDISLSGRIVAVADSFETMTAIRSYKKPISVEEARQELVACAGSHFDPKVVRSFLAIGLGHLGPTSRLVVALQAPLALLAQAGEPLRNALRITAAGGTAAMVMVAGTSIGLLSGSGGDGRPLAAPSSTSTVVPATGGDEDAPTPASTSSSTTTAPPAADPDGRPPVTPGTAPRATSSSTTTTAISGTTTTTRATTSTTSATSTTTTSSSTTTSTTSSTTSTSTTTTTVPPPPLTAVDDAYTVPAGINTVIDPLSNDTGPFDPATLTVTGLSGGLQVDENPDGTLTVRPAPGQAGTTMLLTYEICNASGDCAQAQITLDVLP